MKEEWVELPEWPDYLISNTGKVWSKRRDRPINQYPGIYLKVGIQRDGVWKTVNVHRLVALAFVDGYFEGAKVNHIDGIKHNNNHTNLEWTTQRENIQHAKESGLIRSGKLRTWRLDRETGETVLEEP